MKSLRPSTGQRPDVHVVDIDGKQVVVKDFGNRGFLLRVLVGPWLIGRECRMYQKLSGTPGIPRFHGRLKRHALAYEYVEGQDCSGLDASRLDTAFFSKLAGLLERVHERGVAHCDLKRSANIILSRDGEPHLVDFAAAFPRAARWNVIGTWFFNQMCITDWRGLAKLKRHARPDLMNEADYWLLDHPTAMERLARWLLRR